MKDARDMTPTEYQAARAAYVHESRNPSPAPADTRAALDMTYEEWQAARGPKPKPKLATEMTDAEYRIARAAITRR